jgi:hypothetical protein
VPARERAHHNHHFPAFSKPGFWKSVHQGRYGVTDFAQAAISGLLAGVRARQVADRSVGKVAAILVAPQ